MRTTTAIAHLTYKGFVYWFWIQIFFLEFCSYLLCIYNLINYIKRCNTLNLSNYSVIKYIHIHKCMCTVRMWVTIKIHNWMPINFIWNEMMVTKDMKLSSNWLYRIVIVVSQSNKFLKTKTQSCWLPQAVKNQTSKTRIFCTFVFCNKKRDIYSMC